MLNVGGGVRPPSRVSPLKVKKNLPADAAPPADAAGEADLKGRDRSESEGGRETVGK